MWKALKNPLRFMIRPSCSVQSCSVTQSCLTIATPWTAAHQASLSITSSQSLLKLMPIESVMPSNCLILCCPLLLLPSIFSLSKASGSFPVSQFFTSDGQNIGVSASASVLPKNTKDWSPLEWPGCISLKSKRLTSLIQHNSSKASIHWHSVFFIVQLSYLYMTTGKTIALTIWTFVSKVMSLLSNMLSRWTFVSKVMSLLSNMLQSMGRKEWNTT